MNTEELLKNLKLGKGPYRGIMTEIAKEEGCTQPNIHNAIFKYGNPRIIAIANTKMEKRLAEYKKELTRLCNAKSRKYSISYVYILHIRTG